jgi:hypothetical protein
MVLPHPFHKRLLSRIVFYGGVVAYLVTLQALEHRLQNHPTPAGILAVGR